MTAAADTSATARRATVVAERVSKWYGDVVALSGVSFALGPGTTTVLGPNGAGKSTLLRVLSGLARPSGGAVALLGGDPRRDLALVRHLGYVPEADALFHGSTAAHHVAALARARGVADAAGVAARRLAELGLDPADPRPIRSYSRGMRQRVKLATALAHDPAVVICDEPLEGLDPEQRAAVITLLRDLGDAGRCVVVSTHVLAEAARIGARILALVDGELVADGDYRAIRELMDDRPRRLRIRAEPARWLASSLLAAGVVDAVELVGEETLVVSTVAAAHLRRRLAPLARESGVHLREVAPLDEDLGSVFRYLVGRSGP